MKIAILILFLFIVHATYSQTPKPNKIFPEKVKAMKNPLMGNAVAIKKGNKIYLKSCWNCHGDNGKGNGPQSKEISTKVADFNDKIVVGRTDGELFWWIQTGGNDMESFKDLLSDDEIWSLVTYIRSLQNNPVKK